MSEQKTIVIESMTINCSEGGRDFLNSLQELTENYASAEKVETKEESRARLLKKIAELLKGVEWLEAVNILTSAINDVSVPNAYTATASLRGLISVEGVE